MNLELRKFQTNEEITDIYEKLSEEEKQEFKSLVADFGELPYENLERMLLKIFIYFKEEREQIFFIFENGESESLNLDQKYWQLQSMSGQIFNRFRKLFEKTHNSKFKNIELEKV